MMDRRPKHVHSRKRTTLTSWSHGRRFSSTNQGFSGSMCVFQGVAVASDPSGSPLECRLLLFSCLATLRVVTSACVGQDLERSLYFKRPTPQMICARASVVPSFRWVPGTPSHTEPEEVQLEPYREAHLRCNQLAGARLLRG